MMKNNFTRECNSLFIGTVIGVIMLFAGVVWIGESQKVPAAEEPTTLETSTVVAETTTYSGPNYTEDELFCMAAAIYNEAGGSNCSDETRRMVGYVILNRVNDPRYPNTIREVLEQEGQYAIFDTEGVKLADRYTRVEEQPAVDRAYDIAMEVLDTTTIPIPSTVVFQAGFKQGVEVYSYQDNIYFCHAEEVK